MGAGVALVAGGTGAVPGGACAGGCCDDGGAVGDVGRPCGAFGFGIVVPGGCVAGFGVGRGVWAEALWLPKSTNTDRELF